MTFGATVSLSVGHGDGKPDVTAWTRDTERCEAYISLRNLKLVLNQLVLRFNARQMAGFRIQVLKVHGPRANLKLATEKPPLRGSGTVTRTTRELY